MEFENTRNYVYEKCVDRVKKRLNEKKLPQISICPDDKSLVSNFLNLKCTKNNPYLITKKLLNSNTEDNGITGIIPILEFKNEFEVLWGNEAEFEKNLYPIFENIMFDFAISKPEYFRDIEIILCDHIIYSKYSTFLHLKEKHDISLLKYFGIFDTFVSQQNMDNFFRNALKYLYSKKNFESQFKDIFYKFTKGQKDYKSFVRRLEKDYAISDLIPLLKKYSPTSDSLGLRVKKLIEDDISKVIMQIEEYNPYSPPTPEFLLRKKLINASSTYITKLEEIAEQCQAHNIHL